MPQVQNFIQVIPDRFSGAESTALTQANSGKIYKGGVRRPTRGTVLKKETFATMRVLTAGGKDHITLIDAGGKNKTNKKDKQGKPVDSNPRRSENYTNFLLQQIQEERMEKSQILETFGEPFIFLFGERPRMMSFAGVLLNTFDFNWEAEWWHNYENYLRGTRCVENDARVFLSFDNTVVSGYILSSSASKVSDQPNTVQFQFQMFVTSYANFSKIGDPNAFPGFEYSNGYKNTDFVKEGFSVYMAGMRPTLLPDFGRVNLQSNAISSANKLVAPTLEAGLKAQLSSVAKVWTKIRDTINTTTNMLSDKLNGGGVRVPVGFAGSMEFDDIPVRLTDPETMNYGTVKYSTFDQNTDEYVGPGDQYASSFIRYDNIGADSGDQPMSYDQFLVDVARNIWKNPATVDRGDLQGMIVEPEQLGPLSNFLVKQGVGMQLVAMNKVASKPTAIAETLHGGMVRFANALPNPMGVSSNIEATTKNAVQGPIAQTGARIAMETLL